MARGDMGFDTLAVTGDSEILNRKEFQAIANTIDFTNIDADDNGVKMVPAGTPISNAGVPVTEAPWTGAVGLTLYDVYENRPQVAVLKEGYVHTLRAQAHSGLTYTAALATVLAKAGCRIVFEAGTNGAVIIGA